MATEAERNGRDEAKEEKNKEITFECKFCGMTKPVAEMRVLTRFFPPMVACRDCERRLR